MSNKKEDRIKYDFNNKESQKLFEEFTSLLSQITKYVEGREQQIVLLEEELLRKNSSRAMLKEVVRRLFQKIIQIGKSTKNKVFSIINTSK